MQFVIAIENTDESFHCDEKDSVLKAMEQLQRKGIPVGCRNGGCGVCKVRVIEGNYLKRKISRAVVTAEEEGLGFALACRIHPESDLRVEVVGKLANAVLAPKSDSRNFARAAAQVCQPDEEA